MPTSAVGHRVEHAHLAFTLAVQRALAGGGLRPENGSRAESSVETACWSPYSVACALGLAATGARGTTRAELVALLLGNTEPLGDNERSDAQSIATHNTTDAGKALGTALGTALGEQSAMLAEHSAMLGEASALDSGAIAPGGDQPVLGVANTLWTREDTPIHAEFTAELGRWPSGRVRTAPFQGQPEAARRLINADVAETTRGLIPELLGAGSVTASTVATLVNALYLKVAWRNPFPARGTERRLFHAPSGPLQVPTMRLSNKRLGYAAANGWQVVVLPAAGDVEAVILLPDNTGNAASGRAAAGGDAARGELGTDSRLGGSGTAESTLDADVLASLLAAPAPIPVDLYLPKFTVRARADLTSALAALGARTMFTGQADFSGISDQRMPLSGVRHEAVLTVDEQGLEGAAATGVVMRALALRRDVTEPLVVRVDRPFLFLVRHRASGAVYFLARITHP
ncbi:MAG TPA: serpin family protein [Pseudonocardiaceae bacterium]